MATNWFEGGWSRNVELKGIEYFPPGEYSDSEITPPAIRVPDKALGSLIDWLRDEGYWLARRWLPPEAVTIEQRRPDLEIIDRLLRIIERPVSGGFSGTGEIPAPPGWRSEHDE